MAAWSGIPYERLPDSAKAPAKWAIVGAVIGVVVGLLTGLDPFMLGSGLLMTGAVVGVADNLLGFSGHDESPGIADGNRTGRGNGFGGMARDRGLAADDIDFRSMIESRRSMSQGDRDGLIR